MKRVTWFAGGVVTGITGGAYAARKLKQKAETLKPVNIAKSAVAKVKGKAHDIAEAVREGRDAMHDKEAELKAIRDGDGDLDGDLDGAEVVPVQPGQVIVLKSVPSRQDQGPTRRRRA